MKNKIKKFFSLFRYDNFKEESAKYGEDVTSRNFFVTFLTVMVVIFVVDYLLKLKPSYAVVVVVFTLLCLPSLLISRFRFKYEKVRFNSTVTYLEQMIYSFKKRNKIRVALSDVYSLSTGNMKRVVKSALDYIDRGMTKGDLYRDALNIIERNYNCTRIKVLHDYIIEVERVGGKTSDSLSILLTDVREWSLRVLDYQQQRAALRSKVSTSIVLAMTTCGLMVNLIPKETMGGIVDLPLYQISTAFALILCVVLYVASTNILCGSYLDLEVEGNREDYVMSKWDYLENYDKMNRLKPALIKLGMLVPIVGILIYMRLYYGLVLAVIFGVFIVYQPVLRKKSAIKTVTREVTRTYPIWVRGLILRLQTDNVQMALRNSLNSAPSILKPELVKLLLCIEKMPNSIIPYMMFFKDYDLNSLKMSVHFLYSLAEFGTNDMMSQLDYLIKQNSELTISSEKIQNEDTLAGLGTLTLVPMLIAILKLIVDMLLFFTQFMGMLSTLQ